MICRFKILIYDSKITSSQNLLTFKLVPTGGCTVEKIETITLYLIAWSEVNLEKTVGLIGGF